MANLPDVVVNVTSAATPRTIPTDTGTSFAVGVTQRGSTVKPTLCRSMVDFVNYYGARLSTSVLSDAAETFFAEGGTRLYINRVYGAGATQATVNLLDASAGVSLVVKAGSAGDPDPGTWANGATGGLSIAVVASGANFQFQIFQNGLFVEASYACTTQQDAINWSVLSKYVTISLGASSLVPAVVAATNLVGGTDGAATADADWQGALDRTSKLLGPGQIWAPGRTSAAGQGQLLAHAIAFNRFALMDGVDTASDATLVTQAAALFGSPLNGRRYGQLLAPWDVIPGLTALTTRIVPPSARQAAQYARVDALGNPNQAAAGRNGTAQFVQDLSQPAWNDVQRLNLNNNGVTVSRRRYAGAILTYGFRTLADSIQDTQWSMAPNVRCIMWYVAQAMAIGENHEFNQIDGFGQELASYRGDLMAPAKTLYDRGALFGASPQEAFYVDTGPAVNPIANLAAGIMTAVVKLRTSPGAEQVVINIVKTPITQAI